MSITTRASYVLSKNVPIHSSKPKAALGTKVPSADQDPPDDWLLPGSPPVKPFNEIDRLRSHPRRRIQIKGDQLELQYKWDQICYESGQTMRERKDNNIVCYPPAPVDWKPEELDTPKNRLELRAILCEEVWRARSNSRAIVDLSEGEEESIQRMNDGENHQCEGTTGNGRCATVGRDQLTTVNCSNSGIRQICLEADTNQERMSRQLTSIRQVTAQQWNAWEGQSVDLYGHQSLDETGELRQPKAEVPFGFTWPRRAPHGMVGIINSLSHVYEKLHGYESFNDNTARLFIFLLSYCIPHHPESNQRRHGIFRIQKEYLLHFVAAYHIMAIECASRIARRLTRVRYPMLNWSVDNLNVISPPPLEVLLSNSLTKAFYE